MKLSRLNRADGTWNQFEESWRTECAKYDEDFDTYAQASLNTLREECDDGVADRDSGVFALVDDDGRHHAACFLNRAAIPNYVGKVLRVRHFVLSPYYDFEALELEAYSETLSQYFFALFACSGDELVAPHIKIHYRSPYDRNFFAAFGINMRGTGHFQTVESKGMWLHLTKA
jgi:hypothetical protein